MLQSSFSSVETRKSWEVAGIVLVIMAIAFGAPWVTLVALKDIAAEVNGERSVPALAGALMWIGSGVGGILMGRIAERIGIRVTVIFGSLMVAAGLILLSWGPSWPVYIVHGLFMGLVGIGGINAPFYVYVSRWFDRRRGSALALISSGAYLAGALWPPIFARVIGYSGWRQAMLYYAAFEVLVIVPAALIVLAPPPQDFHHLRKTGELRDAKAVLGWPPNLVFALQMTAIFTCCIPMAMPQTHLVAFCSDLGISAAHGAAMVSVLLGAAFFSRQLWGLVSDRIGGLYAMLAGSACQAAGMIAFLLTQDAVRLRVQRPCACEYIGFARALSRRTGLLAHADIVVVQRLGHGDRRMARRRPLRSFRLLCAGFRGRARGQSSQFPDRYHAGIATQKGGDGISAISARELPPVEYSPAANAARSTG